MNVEIPQPENSWSDDAIATDYRTWNGAAFATGACGALSITAAFAPALLFLPFLTIALAILAWRVQAGEPRRWLGTRWAWFGVGCALATLGCVVAREWSYRDWVFDGARRTAEQWLTFTRDGRPLSAYELTRKPSQRFFADDALEDFLANDPQAKVNYENYIKASSVAELNGAHDSLEWRFERAGWESSQPSRQYVRCDFAVTYRNAARTETVPVKITVERVTGPNDQSEWKILAIDCPQLEGLKR